MHRNTSGTWRGRRLSSGSRRLLAGPTGRSASCRGGSSPVSSTTTYEATPLGCPIGEAGLSCTGAEALARLCNTDVSGLPAPPLEYSGIDSANELVWRAGARPVGTVRIYDDQAAFDQTWVMTPDECLVRLEGSLWRQLLEPGFRGSLPSELR